MADGYKTQKRAIVHGIIQENIQKDEIKSKTF
jgi:hypothetical protein